MKAHFKYAFLTGLNDRGVVFAVILAMFFVFILLGSLGVLPVAALITGVSLGGVAIGVMAVVNCISSIKIIRRMFYAPRAYLTALTPVPRYKLLLSSVVAIAILDIVTMAVVIFGEVWLVMIMSGDFVGFSEILSNLARFDPGAAFVVLSSLMMLFAVYLLIIMFIISCISVRKSLFYQVKFGGLLTAVVAVVGIYLFLLSQLVLAPFGTVSRTGWFFEVNLQFDSFGTLIYSIFMLIYVVALFIVNSKLMERKLNI